MHELINNGQMREYAELRRQALADGVDPATLEHAESLHWQGAALQELAKILKNPDIVSGNIKYGTPEYIHVDAIVVALQRMQDDTSCIDGCSTFVHREHGTSHLEQALGKQGADKLLRDMYAAQRLGKKSARVQRIAKWVAGGIAVLVVLCWTPAPYLSLGLAAFGILSFLVVWLLGGTAGNEVKQ